LRSLAGDGSYVHDVIAGIGRPVVLVGHQDLDIPVALHRFMAQRAGAKATLEVEGASHALSVSNPDAVTASILDALNA
jgi:pimeloyl-ACP methyl ester carboxylesterase